MEFRYNIENLILKNIQVFRSEKAEPSGTLFSLENEAAIKNLIMEDIFAEKIGTVLRVGKEHRIGLLKANNVALKDGGRIFDINEEAVGQRVVSDVNELKTQK